jgi:hypothetical protein
MEENRPEELQAEEEKEAGLSEGADDKAAWKNKARPAIYAMAGFYLVYLSYSMFKEISKTSGTEQMTMVIFSILFAVIGAGGILFGLLAGYKNSKRNKKFLTEIHDESIISTY